MVRHKQTLGMDRVLRLERAGRGMERVMELVFWVSSRPRVMGVVTVLNRVVPAGSRRETS